VAQGISPEFKIQYSKKKDLSYKCIILLLGKYLKESKSTGDRDTCTPLFITALLITAKLWNQSRCPSTGEWMKKMWTYTQ
jgi:hypothetical protein